MNFLFLSFFQWHVLSRPLESNVVLAPDSIWTWSGRLWRIFVFIQLPQRLGALPNLQSKQHFMLSRCYRVNTFPQHMVIISLLLLLLCVRVCACLGRDGLQHQRKHEPRTQSGGFVPYNMKCICRIVLYSGFYTLWSHYDKLILHDPP